MRSLARIAVLVLVIGPACGASSSPQAGRPEPPQPGEELQITDSQVGHYGVYHQIQEIIAANLPYVFLATPNVLVSAEKNLENFKLAILEPTTLRNVEPLIRQKSGVPGRAKR